VPDVSDKAWPRNPIDHFILARLEKKRRSPPVRPPRPSAGCATPVLRERDAANALLARGLSRCLTAEMLRDSALALSGLLSETIGGPLVKSYGR
jgi:hypothetical protein